MALRIISIFILLFSITFLPFWFSALLWLIAIFYFSLFFEGALLFLLSDLLYGAHVTKFSGLLFTTFLSAVFITIAVEILKKFLKFYPEKRK